MQGKKQQLTHLRNKITVNNISSIDLTNTL